MPSEIIHVKDIARVDKPKFETEFSKKLEICNIMGFVGSYIPLEELLVNIEGFNIRFCPRENDRIWVVQEPRCKFYETFSDHHVYRDNQDGCFGRCKNMKDIRQREMYGCIWSKKHGIYLRVNHPEQTYVFARMIE